MATPWHGTHVEEPIVSMGLRERFEEAVIVVRPAPAPTILVAFGITHPAEMLMVAGGVARRTRLRLCGSH